MFDVNHVVAAVDFSPATEPLLECLSELRSVGMETVTLMHVLEMHYGRRPPVEHREMYEDMLSSRAEQLRGKGVAVHTHLETGPSAPRIVDYAEDEEADLILMASRGHNLLQRLLLGSTATEVMRTTTVPVLLDRIEPAEGDGNARCSGVCDKKFRRPLLATDLSDSAEGAEEAALGLTEQAESAVFMTVRDAQDSDVSAGAVRTELEALAERAACPTAVRVEQGRAASAAIAEGADAEDSTVLIVGKHGRGYLEEQVVGSTADALIKRAQRPVLMVPTAAARSRRDAATKAAAATPSA
ncbi:universal stress protein [Salinibacter altiplanensis]|uniref:universal stress protein n=1 Tax=Salinibacter altiplanensis TaxID=1803181 RepID=UPI000C9F174F|nr:universal stress protein [Salinibacter altiplanensis]